ncbi:MAG: permease, partial [Brevibacillus sp.]|nr:permease [Brevibacillus sp.]
MRTWMDKIFHLRACDTTIQRELLAGFISFVTIVYIVAVNASILED